MATDEPQPPSQPAGSRNDPSCSQTSRQPRHKSKDRRAAFIRQASLPLQHVHSSTSPDDDTAAQSPQGPPLHTRWIHTLQTAKGWAAFGAKDSRRIEASWRALQASGTSSQGKDAATHSNQAKDDAATEWPPLDPDQESPIWRVPVGQDKLYDVDLRELKMAPVFWKEPKKLDVLRASWFYEANKLSPCSAQLAEELETKFAEIKPWLASYTDELKSSVSLGAEAEAKLKCTLTSIKNAYVIFQGPRLARLYTEDLTTRLSKQLFTAWSGEHGGGQLLVRGYQTLIQLQEAKRGSSRSESRSDSVRREASKRRSVIADSPAKATEVRVDPSKTHEIAKDLQEAMREDEAKDATEAVKATTDEARNVAERSPVRSESMASQVSVSPSMTIDTASATPSVDVSTTHASATPESAKLGAGARLRSLALAVGNRNTNKNDLFRTVASRIGAWTCGSDAGVGDDNSLTPKQQADIAASFREAQRRALDISASDHDATDDEAKSHLEATDDEQEHGRRYEDEDPDDEDDDEDERPVEDDPEEFDDEEERREEEQQESHPPELLLAIHGIGQRLAGDWKSFDFVVAINAFREMVQSRIDTAKPPADIGGGGLKALAGDRRLQFLPVLWRAGFHIEDDGEQAVASVDDDEDDAFDNGLELDMDHIFGHEGIPIVRTMTREVLMDIPMFFSHHRQHIINSVRREANRQYRLFVKRNPHFEEKGGRVHIIAHSLGSAIATDVLSSQPTKVPLVKDLAPAEVREVGHSRLVFNVEKFFAIGSPVGIWFVLNRSQLIARRGRECRSPSEAEESGLSNESVSRDEVGRYGCMSVSGFYNISNQFDPIGTRCTACVDVKYSKLVKPVALAKATRAILRTDEKAIPPQKEARKEGEDPGPGYDKAAPAANASTNFFSSWGRKADGAAAALSSGAKAKSGKTAPADPSTDKQKESAATDVPPEACAAVRGNAASWSEKASGAAEPDEETDADGDVDHIRQRIKARAEKEEEKQRQKLKEEQETARDEIGPRRKLRAEARLKALNPMQRVDFYMPLEGYSLLSSINQYAELMTAHMSYWGRTDLADFVVTQLLSSEERVRQSLEFKEVEGWE
ncbi:hypothetical protein ACQY0O_002591 [Thecaphora frezii]